MRQITALHGGTVELESAVGQGSCFRVVIPASVTIPETPVTSAPPASLDAALHLRSAGAGAPEPVGEAPLLLLAEDDRIVAMAVADSLRHRGYRVTVAECGVTALAMFAEQRPDLLILDVQMPNLSGLEVVHRLRALPEGRDVPILAMTAYAYEQDWLKLMEAGADAYISKPLVFSQLIEQIETLLSHPTSRTTAPEGIGTPT